MRLKHILPIVLLTSTSVHAGEYQHICDRYSMPTDQCEMYEWSRATLKERRQPITPRMKENFQKSNTRKFFTDWSAYWDGLEHEGSLCIAEGTYGTCHRLNNWLKAYPYY